MTLLKIQYPDGRLVDLFDQQGRQDVEDLKARLCFVTKVRHLTMFDYLEPSVSTDLYMFLERTGQ